MIGSTALEVFSTPYRLIAITRSQSASSLSTNDPTLSQPALLTRTSIRPNFSVTTATMATTDSLLVTSTRRPMAPPPSSFAVVIADCSSMSVTTTVAPSVASFSAIPRPIPRPAPVTIATLSSSLPMTVSPVVSIALSFDRCWEVSGSGCEGPTQFLPGNDQFHDLRGAVTDLQAQDVPKALFDRLFGAVPVLAVQQQAGVDDVVGGLRGPPLAHGGLRGVRQAGVLEPERLVAEQTGCSEEGFGFRQWE